MDQDAAEAILPRQVQVGDNLILAFGQNLCKRTATSCRGLHVHHWIDNITMMLSEPYCLPQDGQGCDKSSKVQVQRLKQLRGRGECTAPDLQPAQSLLVIMLGLVKLYLQLHSLAIQILSSTLKPHYLLTGCLQLFFKVPQLLLQAIELLQDVTQDSYAKQK